MVAAVPVPFRPLIKLWMRFLPHCTACPGRDFIQLIAPEMPCCMACVTDDAMLLMPLASPFRMFAPRFSQLKAEITETMASTILPRSWMMRGMLSIRPLPSCTMRPTAPAKIFGALSLMRPAILMTISGM